MSILPSHTREYTMSCRVLLILLGLITTGLTLPAPAHAESVFDTPPDQIVTTLTAELVKRDPIAVMLMKSPPWDDRARVIELMQHNVHLYDFLPTALREDPEIRALAAKLGLPMGVKIKADVQARVRPAADAAVAHGPSDTTNGYLAAGRPTQSFAAGDRVAVLGTTTVDGVPWTRVTEAVSNSRKDDEKSFNELSNVGGVTFEDFSHAVDEGWIPAAVTEPVIMSARYFTGLYRLNSVQNGDLAIYVGFDGLHFEGFDTPHYTLMTLLESGRIAVGDRIRVVWRESLTESESAGLEWLPFKAWEPDEPSPTPEP
jgi:hypothetical protein